MSAKGYLSEEDARKLVRRDLSELAPKMRAAVEAGIKEARAAGIDVIVYEARRSDELQRAYYAFGRSVVPPHYTITNARTARMSWHFYGLAVDLISESRTWFNDDPVAGAVWFAKLAEIMKKHGLSWGGDWLTTKDLPHFYWGRCGKSPKRAPVIYAESGMIGVWRAVRAI